MKKTSAHRFSLGKRILSICLSLLMAITMLPVLAVFTPKASAAITAESGPTTLTFYVPETIYLKPSDNKTFQYFVNREQSGQFALRTSQDTTGLIYFNCPGASAVTGLTCNGASVNLSTTTSSTDTLITTVNSGATSDAVPMGNTDLITWNLTFTYKGANYTVSAYSGVYAPNRNVTANGVYGYDDNEYDNACASGLIWIQGAQTTGEASYTDDDNSSKGRIVAYQNIDKSSKYLDPLVNGINAAPDDCRPSSYSTGTSPFTAATKSFLGCNCVKEDKRDGDGDWVSHIDYNKTSAGIIVDTSRYSNLKQLPNLKLGYMVTDWANSNQRRNWYVSDATSSVTWSNSTPHLYSDTDRKDLTLHSYWRDDDISKRIYGSAYGTVLATSGNNPPSTDGDHTGDNVITNNDDVGVKYYNAIDYATSGGNKTLFFRGCVSGSQDDWNSNSWSISCAMVSLSVTTVDKSLLRALVNQCIGSYKESGYYKTADWNTYISKLTAAATVLGNPAATGTQIGAAKSELETAKNALTRYTSTATATHTSSTGKALGTDTKTYTYGDTVTVTANEYLGYRLKGNNTTFTVSNIKEAGKSWSFMYDPITYAISYDLDGGTNSASNPTIYTIESSTITLNEPTRAHYKFTGWTGTGLSEPTKTVRIPLGSTGDRSYKAHWELESYTVKFLDEDGNQIGETQLVQYGGSATPPADQTKDPDANYHYSFNGWSGYDNISEDTEIRATFTGAAHTRITVAASDPTCTDPGKTEGVSCRECGYVFTAQTEIPALGHTPKDAVVENSVAATCTVDGGYDTVVYCNVCGDELSREHTVLPAPGHTPKDAVVENSVAATCTVNGSYDSVVYCAVCGAEISRTPITVTAPGHTPKDAVVENSVAATCTVNGSYDSVVYCAVCGAEISREHVTVTAPGHTPKDAVVENNVEPSCTSSGSYDRVIYCRVCNVEISRNTVTVDVLGHDYEADVTPPTCTTDGYTTYTCTRCGDTYTGDIVLAGHTPAEAVEENRTDASCTVDGSYDSVVYCAVCGEELSRDTVTLTAPGHTPAEAVEENRTDATCTEDGSYESVVYCDVCGKELSRNTVPLTALGHNYNAVVTEPTCANGGYTTYTCTRCGDSYVTDETEALGHNFGDWKVTVEPTCEEDGVEARTCARCGETETRPVDALGHEEAEAVEENRTEATCTEDGGYDTVVYCTRCNGEISRVHTVLTALGHDFGDWKITNRPTCTNSGAETRKCVRCKEKETRILDPLGHEMTHVEAKEPTCKDKGNIEYYTCSRCGGKFADAAGETPITGSVVIPAIGHDMEFHQKREATCTEDGNLQYYYCRNCGIYFKYRTGSVQYDVSSADELKIPAGHKLYKVNAVAPTCTASGIIEYYVCTVCENYFADEAATQPISKNDTVVTSTHRWDAGAVTKEPTCVVAGVKTYTCEICGDTKTERIPALGHNFVDDVCANCGLTREQAASSDSEALGGDICEFCGRRHGTSWFARLIYAIHRLYKAIHDFFAVIGK